MQINPYRLFHSAVGHHGTSWALAIPVYLNKSQNKKEKTNGKRTIKETNQYPGG